MKNIFLITLLNLLFFAAFSQSYAVEWGPEYRKEGGLASSFYMAGMTGENYHLIMQPRRDKTLLTFDSNHRLVKNQNMAFEKDGYDLDFNEFIETTAGSFALFSANQRRRDEWQLYVSPFVDNRLGKLEKVYSHSFESPRFLTFNYQAFFIDNLEISPDSNRVSFVNTLDAKVKRNQAQFAVAVFDQNMNLIWDKIQKVPYPDQDLRLEQTLIDNDGSVYVLAKLFEYAPTITFFGIGDGIPNYVYKVFKVTKDGLDEINLKLANNLHMVDAGIFLPQNEKDALLMGGFYTSNEKRSGLNGLFLARSNKETGAISSSIHVLEEEFLEGLISKRDLRKDRGLNSSFRIDDLLFFNDGSFSFIAEEYYITTSQSTDSYGTLQTQTYYNTDQVVIPRFDKNGELLNIEKIEKTFRSSTKGATSYSLALANGKMFLMYSDFKNREERQELRKKNTRGGRYTDMTVIGQDGEIEFQETLFSSKDVDLVFLPSQSAFSSEQLIILGVSGFKKYTCGRIDLR